MIKFFSKLRFNLISKNKTGKYLKYAIGEIILVVIGILIALQINNWNEHRKARAFEYKVLHEIHLDLKEDLIETANSMKAMRDSEVSKDIILRTLNSQIPPNDSLNVHFAHAIRFWSMSPNSTAFEAAKTEGLHLIKNDSIRHVVSKLNTYLFDYLKVLENRWQDYTTNFIQPKIVKRFDYYNFISMEPNNYITLKNDLEYRGMLKTLSSMRKRYIDMLEVRQDWLKRLNQLIEEELND